MLAEEAAQIATQIVEKELAELSPGPNSPTIEIFCGTSSCIGTGARPLPTTVRVLIHVDMFDTMFGVVDVGRYGLPITADVVVPYIGI